MNYKTLSKIKNSAIGIIAILIVYFVYDNIIGRLINKNIATIVCAKIINDYVNENYKILDTNYSGIYNLTDVRVGLNIKYDNQFITSADCIIKRNMKFNTIKIKYALVINDNNKLEIYEKIEIKYNLN